jgi:hypothetical protein
VATLDQVLADMKSDVKALREVNAEARVTSPLGQTCRLLSMSRQGGAFDQYGWSYHVRTRCDATPQFLRVSLRLVGPGATGSGASSTRTRRRDREARV